MDRKHEVPQWSMMVTVSHGPKFGHRVRVEVVTRTHDPITVGEWSWTGIGVPPPLISDLVTRCSSVVSEHLITRYGEALPLF